MLKFFQSVILVSFAFLLSFSYAFAYGRSFGGKIYRSQAPEVTTLTDAGYDCELNGGDTIQVFYKGGLRSYYYNNRPVSRTTPSQNQSVLGLFGGNFVISCTRDEKDSQISRVTVSLPAILHWGTSIR